MKPYIKIGVRNEPSVLPMTTEMTAAASSPPAERVMTTLEAIVVGRQAVASMPRMMGIEGVPCRRAPAARQMCTKAVFHDFVSISHIATITETSLIDNLYSPSIITGIITKLQP